VLNPITCTYSGVVGTRGDTVDVMSNEPTVGGTHWQWRYARDWGWLHAPGPALLLTMWKWSHWALRWLHLALWCLLSN